MNQHGGQQPSQGLAIASLVLGIAGLALGWIIPVLGIVGIILAVMARKNGNTGGIATAGLVLSIISTAIGGALFACTILPACLAVACGGAGMCATMPAMMMY